MLLYRCAISVLAPVLLALAGLNIVIGRASFVDVLQRLGLGHAGPVRRGPVLWLHAASVGEANSAKALIFKMLEADPRLSAIVTTNTTTGRNTVFGWTHPRLTAVLAPVDLRICLKLFRSGWQPNILITIESELWPNRITQFDGPVALISARLSERSAARWAKWPTLARTVLERIDLISAQDEESQRRLITLGARGKTVVDRVMLKETTQLSAPDPADLERFRSVFLRDDTLLAASTHEGEEQMVLAAFLAARSRRPALKLILAPRHPDRGDEVAETLVSLALRFAQRSKGQQPTAAMDVYLADTLGEMPLWYALSGQCFVGGSLVPKGGHTPFEPAAAKCAILHGPHLENFVESYATLARVNGSLRGDNPIMLGDQLAALSPAERNRMTTAAHRALIGNGQRVLTPLLGQLAKLDGLHGIAPETAEIYPLDRSKS